MTCARLVVILTSLTLTLGGLADAADHVLGGGKLTLRRSGSGNLPLCLHRTRLRRRLGGG